MFNVSDINMKLLGYTNSYSARWYRSIVNDDNYVVRRNATHQFYTELGLYKALMKSNKPIAE